MLSPDLLSRLLSSPARRCPRCGSDRFRVTPAGALSCLACSPGDAEHIFVAEPAANCKLRWREWSSDFDGSPEPLAATAAGVAGEFGGAGVANGAAVPAGAAGSPVAGWGWPFEAAAASRLDPAETTTPGRLLIVTTKLAWWFADRGTGWDQPQASPANLGGGMCRPLDQSYFAWLVERLDRANGRKTGREQPPAGSGDGSGGGGQWPGMRDLYDIAFQAANAGVLGEWALIEEQWPRRSPRGYDPFAGCGSGDSEVVDLENGKWVEWPDWHSLVGV
jgi:hypothetical protein